MRPPVPVSMRASNPSADLLVPADYVPGEVVRFVLPGHNQPERFVYKLFHLDSSLLEPYEDVFEYRAQPVRFLFSADSIAKSNNEVCLPVDRSDLQFQASLFFTRSQLIPSTPGIASSFNLSMSVVFPAPDAPVNTMIAG